MNTKLDKILAEISAGELIDKISILEIKKAKISNKDKFNEHLQGLNLPEYKDDKDLEWYSNTYYK